MCVYFLHDGTDRYENMTLNTYSWKLDHLQKNNSIKYDVNYNTITVESNVYSSHSFLHSFQAKNFLF